MEKEKGGIYYTSTLPIKDCKICIGYPPEIVNSFLLSKLTKFGFLEEGLCSFGKNPKYVSSYPENIRFAIGNNIDGYVKNRWLEDIIIEVNEGRNVYIDNRMFNKTIKLFRKTKEIDSFKIYYSSRTCRDVIMPCNHSLSLLFGLFGKFYAKDLSLRDSRILGDVQESLLLGNCLRLDEAKRVKSIMDTVWNSLYVDFPQNNIFSKIEEGLEDYIYVDDLMQPFSVA